MDRNFFFFPIKENTQLQNGKDKMIAPKSHAFLGASRKTEPPDLITSVSVVKQTTNVQKQFDEVKKLYAPNLLNLQSNRSSRINNNLHQRIKSNIESSKQIQEWKTEKVRINAQDLFQIGSGGITLPDLSYKNTKLMDKEKIESLDLRLKKSIINKKVLGEQSKKFIKKQILPVRFAADQSRTCISVLNFFKKESKKNNYLSKMNEIEPQSKQDSHGQKNILSEHSSYFINQKGMNDYDNTPYSISPFKNQENDIDNDNTNNNIIKEIVNIIQPKKELEIEQQQDNYLFPQVLQEEEVENQDEDENYDDELTEEQQEIQDNLLQKHKMRVNFTAKRKIVHGISEELFQIPKETYIQPIFMQERGTMCVTELWPKNMKRELIRTHSQNKKRLKERQNSETSPIKTQEYSYFSSVDKPNNFQANDTDKSPFQSTTKSQTYHKSNKFVSYSTAPSSAHMKTRHSFQESLFKSPKGILQGTPSRTTSSQQMRSIDFQTQDDIFSSDKKSYVYYKQNSSSKSVYFPQNKSEEKTNLVESVFAQLKEQQKSSYDKSFQNFSLFALKATSSNNLKSQKGNNQSSHRSNLSQSIHQKLEDIRNDCKFALENNSQLKSSINKKKDEVGIKLNQILSSLK